MDVPRSLPWGIAVCAALALVSWVFWPRKQRSPKKTGAYDPRTGLGRGAPGFQTNVQRVALPAELVARIRAGEQVSAEEITAAQARVAQGVPEPAKHNDWLPPTQAPKKKGTRQRRSKK
ncbi:hypothetical protein MEQU1_001652 [Malassezia equina]|uniref:Uncharacterized protein n=1 Tax=Malassezia equina TaxID=1381935 RepID=A0AAF0EEJ5_9BASI|nr:hypothetical protein MEQU1_001652 [Malassezia equina]